MHCCVFLGILEDSKSTQTCVTKSLAANEIASSEKRTHCGTQCTKTSVHTSGTLAQKQQNGFRVTEVGLELYLCYFLHAGYPTASGPGPIYLLEVKEKILLGQPQHY